MGGRIGYDMRRFSGEMQKTMQRSLIVTVDASTNTYVWEPWFALLGGNLTVSGARSTSDNEAQSLSNSNKSSSLAVSGSGQLRVVPYSRYPFEAHVDRTDNRYSSELLSVGAYTSQRFGFSQRATLENGDALFAWDRSNQENDANGKTQQDTLQLNLSHNLELHGFRLAANRSHNRQLTAGDSVSDSNVTLYHSYLPTDSITLDTTFSAHRSNFRIAESGAGSQMKQVSTVGFWRPEEIPLTVTGTARMLGMEADFVSAEASGFASTAKMRSANMGIGASYNLNERTSMNALANVNTTQGQSGDPVSTRNVSAGVTYIPETIEIGAFRYQWNANASANHSVVPEATTTQLTLQLSHSVNRAFELGETSTLNFEANQSLAARFGNSGPVIGLESTRQVTHGASVSWNRRSEDGTGTAMIRLSASDSRALDGYRDYFQMINLQASSSLATSSTTSWSGNLTIQSIRQGGENPMRMDSSMQNANPYSLGENTYNGGFTTTSSGSITYQNNRLFRVRQLRFVSDLRLNGQALLPLFGGPQSQELAAWDNRLDYLLGRTTLRVAGLISRASHPVRMRREPGAPPEIARETRVNKSIMFSVTRAFGD